MRFRVILLLSDRNARCLNVIDFFFFCRQYQYLIISNVKLFKTLVFHVVFRDNIPFDGYSWCTYCVVNLFNHPDPVGLTRSNITPVYVCKSAKYLYICYVLLLFSLAIDRDNDKYERIQNNSHLGWAQSIKSQVRKWDCRIQI